MKKIVAVCACPAGIAHTYMAAENLENFAKRKGYGIKVETNGSAGVENRLSEQNIKEADVVIIAADTKVEMERFKGKKLLMASVSDAVRKVETIFEKIENANIDIY
ncbi:fructose-specific phosphotransferase system IIB component [Breznakia sp. PF5-3]|uniref:PTS fructose transporter subunit IIB n=1 Tax=unclassified Breznakia TaxID=2623764 RepID=UPI0024067C03|nr:MULTISPECIES: PTS fructose transporter subunit IIB [unclassified Breznakia]MDF9825791.1 fructose-specific phosphotransferase system IIB component [Breznakia sp. PM6-1]MDF9836596.1 fructose-specific phosphotransferase system IIB component [Breznakia sp. PF5-3]MDF9838828.1 fructose-specific phosphotransferase system IIB component [Breznakia sp. PFB2-8]MDF9860859.1 fructose-specific phosphotransferase system IIB component [Breznakia sp. PH5-24]